MPEDYTQFLLKYNGGIPKKTDFDYEGIDGEESSVVQLFLSLGDQHSENIKQDYNYYLLEGRILEGIVPIAYDPFGNLICLSLVEETYRYGFGTMNWKKKRTISFLLQKPLMIL